MESTNSGPGGADSSGEPGQTTGKSVGGSAATGSGSTTAGVGGPTRPSAYVPGRLDIKPVSYTHLTLPTIPEV